MIDRNGLPGIAVNTAEALATQPRVGHNRWFPDLDPALRVTPGTAFWLDLIDASDALVGANNPAQPWDHDRIHPLTGPVAVEGAEPGDILEVRVLDVETGPTGWTSARPGQGLLGAFIHSDLYAVWSLEAGFARSPDLPGIRVPARSFPGCLGVAPSWDFVQEHRAREAVLRGRGAVTAVDRAEGAIPPRAREGLRTLPPRPNGGNLDVPHLTRGSRAYFVVQVRDAMLSAGDLHFAQGEGELGGSAIETNGTVLLTTRLHRGSALRPTNPLISYADEGRGPSICATGQATPDVGVADLAAAARAAAANLADLVTSLTGLGMDQTSILFSVAADLSFAQLVNHPYPTATVRLPLSVFEEHPSRARFEDFFGETVGADSDHG